jgi:hypothetical protein
VKEFHEAEGKLTYLERMLNQTAQRNLTAAERDQAMIKLVAMLREWALKPKKTTDTHGIANLAEQ